jgi:hypothetical protein
MVKTKKQPKKLVDRWMAYPSATVTPAKTKETSSKKKTKK